MAFKGGLILGLVLMTGSFVLVSYTGAFPMMGRGLGEIFFIPTIAGLMLLLVLGGTIAGVSRNDEWPGFVVGSVVSLYLVSTAQWIIAWF